LTEASGLRSSHRSGSLSGVEEQGQTLICTSRSSPARGRSSRWATFCCTKDHTESEEGRSRERSGQFTRWWRSGADQA
jgi:hypothetical protein